LINLEKHRNLTPLIPFEVGDLALRGMSSDFGEEEEDVGPNLFVFLSYKD